MGAPHYPSLAEYVTSWASDDSLRGLDAVVVAIGEGARQVQPLIQAAALAGVLGLEGGVNVQGEAVQRLDAQGSDIFVKTLTDSGAVAALGSEEIEEPVLIGDGPAHRYIVHTDPIDGSSNIDVASSIGSLFGIWRRRSDEAVTSESMLRRGREQVAAAYVLYGTSTVLVVATRDGVQGFTLDAPTGVFRLTHDDLTFPEKCEYYSINEGNVGQTDEGTQRAVAELRAAHSLRYSGALVADFHRNLLKGGVFLYPGDRKSPDGKLRLNYEANPLGFIAVKAGGAAYNGLEPILDIMPTALHQRTPLVIGNKPEVEHAVATIRGS